MGQSLGMFFKETSATPISIGILIKVTSACLSQPVHDRLEALQLTLDLAPLLEGAVTIAVLAGDTVGLQATIL